MTLKRGSVLLRALDALWQRLPLPGLYLVALLELPLAVLLVTEGLTRSLLNYSNPAPLELRIYAVAAGTFLAAAATYRAKMHVVLDFGLFKPGLGLAVINKWSALVSFVVAALLLYGFTTMVIASYDSGATSLTQLRTPLVVPQGLAWLGLATFVIELAVRVFRTPADPAATTREVSLA